MGKGVIFSNPALQQKNPSGTTFNLVANTSNFNSLFNVKPLSQPEISFIESLLIEGCDSENYSDVKIKEDLHSLKILTEELKAIGKQGILLMGERISKARDLLKSYHNGTFSKWLDSTFGSKKTGYNLLAYFDFYSALPEMELKEKFKQIPQKAAYILASRQGEMSKKAEIIKTHGTEKPAELISIIHEKLPSKDRRGQKDRSLVKILKLNNELKILIEKKKKLSQESRGALGELRDLIESILAK